MGGAVTANLKELASGNEPWELTDYQLWVKGLGYSAFPGYLADVMLSGLASSDNPSIGSFMREMNESSELSLLGPAGAIVGNLAKAGLVGMDVAGDGDSESYKEMIEDQKIAIDSLFRASPIPYHFISKPLYYHILNSWYFDLNPGAELQYDRREKRRGKGN